ncbi:MAG: porin [Nitrospinota bacterium]|nr:porin [Nitrospinota bacterium]
MRKIIIAMAVCAGVVANGEICLAQEAAPQGLKIGGFVNSLYDTNMTRETSSFSMDQAELDISRETSASGFLLNLNYLGGQAATTDEVVEQGYVWLALGQSARLAMGKFNAPIGFESVDPVDMYQISHAMVYSYGLPTNLTGLKFSMTASALDLVLYVVNGWDQLVDDNKDKTFGARAGFNISRSFVLGLSVIAGAEGRDTIAESLESQALVKVKTNNLMVIDLDFTATPAEATTIGGEFNFGTFSKQSAVKQGDDASWLAFMLLLNQKLSSKFALTARYDYFNDNDGARLGGGIKESRHAATLCADYLAAEGFRILGEFKYTMSSKKVFTDGSGKPTDAEMSLAAEALYSF